MCKFGLLYTELVCSCVDFVHLKYAFPRPARIEGHPVQAVEDVLLQLLKAVVLARAYQERDDADEMAFCLNRLVRASISNL